MNIEKMIDLLPDSVKLDVIDFTTVHMKDGKIGTRVLLDHVLTDDEKAVFTERALKHIVGLDCICSYRYAPEIRKSYFYIV